MLESVYQSRVLDKLRDMFPGCVILRNDSAYLQGIPDWTILYGRYWAALEIKASRRSRRQPNQSWYVEKLGEMSFAAFIFPDNEEEVLDALEQALRPRRRTRVPQRV